MTQRKGFNNITGEIGVLGCGQVSWDIYDDAGARHNIKTLAYHVLQAKVRLISIQKFLHFNNRQFEMEGDQAIFRFNKTNKLTFKTFDNNNKICLLLIAYLAKAHNHRQKKSSVYNVVAQENTNLTTSQK